MGPRMDCDTGKSLAYDWLSCYRQVTAKGTTALSCASRLCLVKDWVSDPAAAAGDVHRHRIECGQLHFAENKV